MRYLNPMRYGRGDYYYIDLPKAKCHVPSRDRTLQCEILGFRENIYVKMLFAEVGVLRFVARTAKLSSYVYFRTVKFCKTIEK